LHDVYSCRVSVLCSESLMVGSFDHWVLLLQCIYILGCLHCQEFIIAESLLSRGSFSSPEAFHYLIAGSSDIMVFIIARRVLFAGSCHCRESIITGWL